MEKSGQIATVLIVEDMDWIRSGMREAFEFAEQQAIDLIVTEEELPSFDTLMAALHQNPTLSNVPVVIINPDAEDGARLGDAYVLAAYADMPSFFGVVPPQQTLRRYSRNLSQTS